MEHFYLFDNEESYAVRYDNVIGARKELMRVRDNGYGGASKVAFVIVVRLDRECDDEYLVVSFSDVSKRDKEYDDFLFSVDKYLSSRVLTR